MAETGGTYLPPVIASLVGDIGDLASTLVEGKAMLEDFSKTETTAHVGVDVRPTSLMLPQLALIRTLVESNLAQAGEIPLHFGQVAEMWAEKAGIDAVLEANFSSVGRIPLHLDYVPLLTGMVEAETVIDAEWREIGDSAGSAGGARAAESWWAAFLTRMMAAKAGGSIWSALGFGQGATIPFTGIAVAGFGTLAGLAGFGLERTITLLLGLVGSLSMAIMGLGVIAAGTFATMAVGMGSDMMVMKSTISDTQTLFKTLQQLQQAQIQYGVNSAQAQFYTQQLNTQMQILGNTAGVQAELGLAKLAMTIGTQWDKATSNARVQAVGLLTQILLLGQSYIPLVAEAARRNLAIINTGLAPLFVWLKGPQGMGIFTDLENKFARDLPTSIDAFNKGIEFMLRFLDLASQYTGGFMQWLDRLFTYLNSPQGWARVTKDVQDVIKVFDVWKKFIDILFKDLFLLLGQSVGVGTTMIGMLTGILTKLHDYLTSTSGQKAIGNLFEAHKKEVVALLNLLPQLAPMLSVYLALAVPLTTLAADVITLLNFMLSIPAVGPALAWGIALTIIVRQMQLMALLTGLAGLIRGIGLAMVLTGAAFTGKDVLFGNVAKALWGVDAATAAAALPFVMVAALIIALAVLIALVVTHWQQLGDLLGGFGALFQELGFKLYAAALLGLTGWGQTFSLLGTMFHNAIGQWGAAFSMFGTMWHLIILKIKKEFTDAFSQWGDAFNLLGTAVHLIGDKISGEFNSWISTAKTTLGQWKSIGASIVQGVIDGITSKAGWAKNQVGNFFGELYKTAKSHVLPGSGSKVYAALASTIPQGVADGINQNTAMALMALSSMFNQMQSHSRMLSGGAGAYGMPNMAFAGASGRGPVSINMPITVQVSGASSATPQGIGTAVQQGVHKELDKLVMALQGGIYGNPGQG